MLSETNKFIMNSRSSDLPTMFTHLQKIYNNEASKNKQQQRYQKNLYHNIISLQRNQKQQLRSRQRYLNKLENSQINNFWDNQEQKRRQRQRQIRRKEMQMIKANKSVIDNLQNFKVEDKYQVIEDYDAYGSFLEKQKQKIRQQKEKVRLENLYQRDLKTMMDHMNKKQDYELAHKKLQQQKYFYQKRQQQLHQRRERHVQNRSAFDHYDNIHRKKQIESDLLEDYIVNKGASELQQRMFNQKLAQAERSNSIRNKFISQLKSQVQDDQVRNFQDRKKLAQSDRKVMEDRYKYMMELQQQRKKRKSLQSKKHLQVLSSQLKPRSLIPEKEPIQDAGIGSPVHIGKYMNDDRKRQLEWIQRNLQRQLHLQ